MSIVLDEEETFHQIIVADDLPDGVIAVKEEEHAPTTKEKVFQERTNDRYCK